MVDVLRKDPEQTFEWELTQPATWILTAWAHNFRLLSLEIPLLNYFSS